MAALRGGAVSAAAGAGVGGAAAGVALRGLAGGGAPREPPLRAGSPLQVSGGGCAAGRAVTRGGRGGSRGGGTTCAGSGPAAPAAGGGPCLDRGSPFRRPSRAPGALPPGVGWWRHHKRRDPRGGGAAARPRDPPGRGVSVSSFPAGGDTQLLGSEDRGGAGSVPPSRGRSIPAPPSATCGRGGDGGAVWDIDTRRFR